MNQLHIQQNKAIDSAKRGAWEEAKVINQEIIANWPDDVAALNRLGYCYLQLNDKSQAIETYKQVLQKQKLNTVAKKYLELLKKNITVKPVQSTSFDDFVEEPRRTKVIELTRLAGINVLENLSVALPCNLKTKGRYVGVTTVEGEYIGSLPEDISLHLSGLIKSGNEYVCLIRSVSKQECVVFIKELTVTEANKFVPSFPVKQLQKKMDTDEDIYLAEEILSDSIPTKGSVKTLDEDESPEDEAEVDDEVFDDE